MNQYTAQRLCTWSGLVGVLVFFLGIVISYFFPPPSPSRTMEEVVTHYQQHTNAIRAGMVIVLISGMFIAPMVGVISAQLKRIAGLSPALVYGQISAGTLGAVFFFIAPLMFLTTAFRPDRSPELTYLMNDLSWITLVIPWPPAFMQCMVIAVAIFSDKQAAPIFPRWLGYLNVWVAIGFIPGGLLAFFKSGPFAWNGIFVFWLAGSVFFLWFVAMTAMLLKAIRVQQMQNA